MKLTKVDTIEKGELKTNVLVTEDVKKFLISKGINPNVSERIPGPDAWYQNLLDEKKRKGEKEFSLIYCGIINAEPLHNHLSIKEISRMLGITEKRITYDGSTTITEAKPRFFIRWIVVISEGKTKR